MDTRYQIEIKRLLQGNEVLTKSKNEELEDEVFYFIAEEEKLDYIFETEDVCLCGNRKNKRFYDCKECHVWTIREQPRNASCAGKITLVSARAENATSKTARIVAK
ncbi:19060_t:CDS:1 [Gigaspora rosea]|nr:19060_t:CDS:1 [Gigaspora rosea]